VDLQVLSVVAPSVEDRAWQDRACQDRAWQDHPGTAGGWLHGAKTGSSSQRAGGAIA